jgi:1-acyl-sn-glycerol-3-phosphate acyltransferase
MIFSFFRWLAIINAYPVQLLLFKRKTYYENKAVQGKKIKGGVLVISNHYNFFDYVLNMFMLLPRKLNVVAGEIGYSNRFIAWGTRCFGGIKCDRIIKSMRFIDESVKLLKKGKLVQIFPEGHNTRDGNMDQFKTSYLMIALRAKSPIVPIITDGNYGFFKRAHVIIGTPINLSDYCKSENPSKEEIVALNEIVYNKALSLRAQLKELGGK